jgi:DNA-binding MarR family transcriptional regulator
VANPPVRAPISDAKLQALAQAKQASVGQLLLKAARLLDEVAVARVNRAAPSTALRPVHTKLFPHIDFQGTRLVALADRLGVTKQAVSQWVSELAEMGVVELVADPDDGRAKRVRFTPRGVEAIHHGLGVLRSIEDEVTARVGARRMAALRQTLADLVPALEALHTREAGDATSAGDSR